jgi:predicted nucleotidyltransferase component of viral defense system
MAKKSDPKTTMVAFEKIKSIALTALFSDDDLFEMLVLKGGNALNLIYKIAGRASVDLDFSIEQKIKKEDQNLISNKMNDTLNKTFNENGYHLFDYKFFERPKNVGDKRPEFWGGYRAEFKVIELNIFDQFKDNLDDLRRRSTVISDSQNKTFSIDISKYEYIEKKVARFFEGLTIYVYSPEMICFEKLRAICQQMPEYLVSIKGNDTGNTPRARDFYDIYLITQKLNIDLYTSENIEMCKQIFAIKKVPLELISKIRDTKDFHIQDYNSLKDSVLVGDSIKEFEFYFDYVVAFSDKLTSLLDDKVST